MEQTDDVKKWIACWKVLNGKAAKKKESKQAESLWNQRAEGVFKRLSPLSPDKDPKRTDEILGFLEEAGFRAKGAKVLDIGCGPGALSIPLARAGAQVTSFDVSSKMLDHLKEIADSEALSVKTIVGSWWTADIDKLGLRKKFDLVIASRTPAINNAETFEWMMACSREYCYFNGFFQGGKNGGPKAFQNIYRTILKVDPPRSEQGQQNRPSPFIYPFMYLYLNEYRPLVRITHNRRKEAIDWIEASDRAIGVIGQSHTLTETTKKKIRDYYKKSAENGKSRSQSDMYTGMMVWNVNR